MLFFVLFFISYISYQFAIEMNDFKFFFVQLAKYCVFIVFRRKLLWEQKKIKLSTFSRENTHFHVNKKGRSERKPCLMFTQGTDRLSIAFGLQLSKYNKKEQNQHKLSYQNIEFRYSGKVKLWAYFLTINNGRKSKRILFPVTLMWMWTFSYPNSKKFPVTVREVPTFDLSTDEGVLWLS